MLFVLFLVVIVCFLIPYRCAWAIGGGLLVMPDTIDISRSLILWRDAQKLNLVVPAIAQNALNGNSSERDHVLCRLCVSRGRKHGCVSSQVLKMSKMSYGKLYICTEDIIHFLPWKNKAVLFLFCHSSVKFMKCKCEVYVLCIFALTLERNRSLLLSTEQFFKVSVYIPFAY